MNKNRHRIIFNAARGHRMVVAETAGSHGGAAAGEAAPGSTRSPWADAAIKRSLTALAVLLLCTPAHPQIVADPGAPSNQRPTILQTANGLPQIDIQTPSAAGVSRNTYSRFDVQSNGAILNNSRSNVSTQLGGHIAANPWLATGEARVILNEVHSSHPSHLNGYVELAGRRAEVIIANPAGIQVNGGGFINAAGVTLTTGTPVMNSGHLDAFRVQGGSVNIEGLGLDTSTADHTTILTRAMQVNAGVWAKDLTVVTGSNEVQALASGASALSTPIAGSGAVPTFMLDVGALGGMYAGKIHLVGTEAGLGVNNRGSLIAHEGTWVLQTDGSLVNTGEIHAKGDLSIQTAGSVSNTGVNASISSQAHTALSAGGAVDNTDGEIASAGMLSVATQGPLTNLRGRLLAVGDSTIDTQGALLDNTAGRINAQATLTLNTGELLNGAQASQAGLIGSNGDLSIHAGVATNGADGATQSNIWSAQTARLSTQSFTNAGVLSGRHVALDVTAEATNAAGASVTATDSIAIDAVTFNNRGSVYANETADPATPSLVHIQATTLNNTGAGAIFGDQIAMAATTLNNRPEAGGTTAPVIAARQQLDMGVQTLNNEDGALIYSGGNMAIAGSLDATLSATGEAQTIHNLSAQIETVGDLRMSLCIPPFCYGASSVSASGGAQNIQSDFASVTEQSGLKAGDGGFQVNVQGDTTLTGGAITSTDKAVQENRNQFATGGELITSDIQNHARFEAEGYSVNLALAVQGADARTPEEKSKAPAAPAKNEGSAGIGEDSGEASSTTQAAISGIAGNTPARTGDEESGIQPIFDKDRVQQEIDAQIKITAEFGKSAASAWGKYANKKFVDAVAAGDEEAAGCWAPDGGCRAGGHALIGGLAGGAGGAAGAGLSSAAAPHVQAFLVASGVPDDAAKAITQLSALGAGTAAGGAAGGAAGLNEASNNALVALPLLLESIAAGGAIAARACLTSPACVNALRLGGATVVAKIASLVDPADLAKIPGFGTTSPLPPVGPTIKPAEIQKIYGTPPLNEPQELKAWLAQVLDGYPADEAAKWAEDFVSTLPASQRQSMSDFIMMSVQDNAVAGSRREREVTADLLAQYPGGSVQNQQYLRDKDGNIVIDPNTGTARRLHHVVIVGGKVIEVVETTSLTADKDQQILHERETRRAGGTFIRDRETGKLVEVSDVSRIERRP